MRQNLVAMLADLFNMLEVHPVNSVKYPGSGKFEQLPWMPCIACYRLVMGVCGHNIKDSSPTNLINLLKWTLKRYSYASLSCSHF